jgi:predicted dehydrogenase
MDVGVYCIQASRYSIGEEPIAVTAQEFKTDPVKFAEVDETLTWQLEFPGGAVANSTTSYNLGTNRLFVTYADPRGRAEFQPAYNYNGLRGYVGREMLKFEVPSQQALHMDTIAESIRTGKPTTFGGDEGMRDMVIVEAIYRSVAEGGKRISLG